MKVSEKSLELNLGAELLLHMRSAWGLKKAYLRGLTQSEERREGVDFFVHLSPSTKLFAFQFKAAKGKNEATPYKYKLVDYQHDKLHALAVTCPGSVFYVFPFYVGFKKLQSDVPTLMKDTWLLDVAGMSPASLFGGKKSKTISCSPGLAKVNPEYELRRLESISLTPEKGMNPDQFAHWYEMFRSARDSDAGRSMRPARRNPWLARGLRVIIVPDTEPAT